MTCHPLLCRHWMRSCAGQRQAFVPSAREKPHCHTHYQLHHHSFINKLVILIVFWLLQSWAGMLVVFIYARRKEAGVLFFIFLLSGCPRVHLSAGLFHEGKKTHWNCSGAEFISCLPIMHLLRERANTWGSNKTKSIFFLLEHFSWSRNFVRNIYLKQIPWVF